MRRAWKQPAAIEVLAKDVDVRQQPPSFLWSVVKALPWESPIRLDLARRVQFAYPGDFWANHELGFVLAGKHPRRFDITRRRWPSARTIQVCCQSCHGPAYRGGVRGSHADLQRAIAVAPRYAAAYEQLGNILLDQQKLDEAIACQKKAIELAPNRGYAWQYLGWIHYRKGNWKSSIEALEKSCKLQPGGTGDCGQWIVLALAHAKLAAAGRLARERTGSSPGGGPPLVRAGRQATR